MSSLSPRTARPGAYGLKPCRFMNLAGWRFNAPARSSSILQNKNGQCGWHPSRVLSPSLTPREKPASNGKGTHSMLCSKCNQSVDGLTDRGLCPDCHLEAEERRSEIIDLA